ncbi:histidine kinase [Nocardioides sp. KR10-350]
MSADRGRRALGWGLAALAILLLASVPFSLAGGVVDRPRVSFESGTGDTVAATLVVVGFALSGALLIHLRPRNWIGWILVVSALLQVTNVSMDAYSARALTDPDHSLPLGLPAAWLMSWTWLPSLLLPVLVLPALYPTGRAPSRFWRAYVSFALATTLLGSISLAVIEGTIDDTVRGTRLPWTAPDWLEVALVGTFTVMLALSAVTVLVGTMVRVVRARYPERQQLLWLLVVIAVMLATVLSPWETVFVTAYALVPVAIAIGVLRYGLLGIQMALRRGLVYVGLTLLVALVVGGLTTALAGLLPGRRLSLVIASAVVAVLVLPVARWLQVQVDRLVLGVRDPLALVGDVGAGLEVASDDPVASMLEAVSSAAGASYAAVRDLSSRELASVGLPTLTTTTIPLRHGGQELGALVVAGAGDLRVVAALAPHLAVVLRSQLLTAELDRARRRVTNATLAERDRLRRDLHDGLGPSLSGIALGLEAAGGLVGSEPDAAAEILARTRAEAEVAVREVRRVIDGLRPSALDLHGLAGAVRDTASALGLGRPGLPSFSLSTDPLPLLAPRTEEAAYRIVAESLTNVVRHADAEHCSVRVRGRRALPRRRRHRPLDARPRRGRRHPAAARRPPGSRRTRPHHARGRRPRLRRAAGRRAGLPGEGVGRGADPRRRTLRRRR